MLKNNHCIKCNKLIWKNSIRCKSCARKIDMRKRKGKKHPAYKNGITSKISYCQECKKRLSHFRYKYCRSCSIREERHFRYGKKCPEISKRMKGKNNPFYGKHPNHQGYNNPRYINGKSKEPYPLEFNKQLKQEIRERDNYKCRKCEMTEEEHITIYGRVLCVHHIDYNKKNCNKENLLSLCNGCNIRVNVNRKYWTIYFKEIIYETR